MDKKQPTPIKRYDLLTRHHAAYMPSIGDPQMPVRPQGAWVRYADLEPLLSSHAALLDALDEIVKNSIDFPHAPLGEAASPAALAAIAKAREVTS